MSVTYVPYNPWKEQLLASLVPTFLNQIRESEKNKKMNALLGELANPNRQAAQVPDGTMPQTGQSDANSITAPGMAQPLDLSSIRSVNPASANPASTSSSMNANASAGASNAAIEQMLSQASMQGNHVTNFSDLFSLLGTPRFNGVNSAEAIANATPFLQEIAAAEQARQQALAEQQQRERATAYMQNFPASNPNVANIMQFLFGGDAAGAINRDLAKAAMGELGQLGGKPVSNNLGGAIANYGYSPMTNEYSAGPIGQVTISPDQQSRYNLGMAQVKQSDINSRRSAGVSAANNKRSVGLGYAQLKVRQDELAARNALQAVNNAAIESILANGNYTPREVDTVNLSRAGVQTPLLTKMMGDSGGGNGDLSYADLLKYSAQMAESEAPDPMEEFLNGNGDGKNTTPRETPFTDLTKQLIMNAAGKRNININGGLTLTPIDDGLWQDDQGNIYTDEDVMAMYGENNSQN